MAPAKVSCIPTPRQPYTKTKLPNGPPLSSCPPVRGAAKNRVGHLWFLLVALESRTAMEKNGEVKPRTIHLVPKKGTKPAMPMQVEDEVEIMDDSEDELIVNRSSNKRDYSRGSSGSFDQDNHNLYKMNSEDLDDDTEEELSHLYEDDDDILESPGDVKPDIKPEALTNGNVAINGHCQLVDDDEINAENNETFENDVERIINKKAGRKSKTSASFDSEEEVSIPYEIVDDLQNTRGFVEEQKIANRRRRTVKVVEDLSSPIPPPPLIKIRLTRCDETPTKKVVTEKVEEKKQDKDISDLPNGTLDNSIQDEAPVQVEQIEVNTKIDDIKMIDEVKEEPVESTTDVTAATDIESNEVETVQTLEEVTPMEITAEETPPKVDDSSKTNETLEKIIEEIEVKEENVPDDEQQSDKQVQSVADSLVEGRKPKHIIDTKRYS